MTNGLDALEGARKRSQANRAKNIPPSRHKPRSKPVEVKPDSTEPEQQQPTTEPAPEPKQTAAKPKPPKPKPEPEPELQEQQPPAGERLTKRTIHLGRSEDDFLEDVFITGRRHQGGRVDANRSAVVRLALRRLAADQTPDEIVETIRTGTTRPATGRPRF